MKRKTFLKSLGQGAAFALLFPCAQGCSKDTTATSGEIKEVPENIDFTIDLDADEATRLQTNGGFILKNDVVVVKNLEGKFVAATQICSHEGYDQVRFISQDGGVFYCDVHGSKFDQTGEPLNQVNGSTAKAIKVYKTEVSENILRVFE